MSRARALAMMTKVKVDLGVATIIPSIPCHRYLGTIRRVESVITLSLPHYTIQNDSVHQDGPQHKTFRPGAVKIRSVVSDLAIGINLRSHAEDNSIFRHNQVVVTNFSVSKQLFSFLRSEI